jgi:uncharacterized membrane protein YjjP (DUF1212 family)
MPRWGELAIQAEDTGARILCAVEADPAGVDMDRVASTVRAIEDLCAGRLASDAAPGTITRISKAPPPPPWLLALAAVVGAVALSVLLGVQHLQAATIILVSACNSATHLDAIQYKHFSRTILCGIGCHVHHLGDELRPHHS